MYLYRIQLKRMQDWTAKCLANAHTIRQTATNLPGLRVPAVPEYKKLFEL